MILDMTHSTPRLFMTARVPLRAFVHALSFCFCLIRKTMSTNSNANNGEPTATLEQHGETHRRPGERVHGEGTCKFVAGKVLLPLPAKDYFRSARDELEGKIKPAQGKSGKGKSGKSGGKQGGRRGSKGNKNLRQRQLLPTSNTVPAPNIQPSDVLPAATTVPAATR